MKLCVRFLPFYAAHPDGYRAECHNPL